MSHDGSPWEDLVIVSLSFCHSQRYSTPEAAEEMLPSDKCVASSLVLTRAPDLLHLAQGSGMLEAGPSQLLVRLSPTLSFLLPCLPILLVSHAFDEQVQMHAPSHLKTGRFEI